MLLSGSACDRELSAELKAGSYPYPQDAPPVRCNHVNQPPPAAFVDGFTFAPGFELNLRAPLNYRHDRVHPLLLVFPAAGQGAASNERYTHLTREATSRGYIVAYLASRPMTLKHIETAMTAATAVSARWCVDEAQIYATGHSNGGTLSVAAGILPESPFRPRAIAPSAAGFSAVSLADFECPTTLPAMVTGKIDDRLFPGFARELGDWLAHCNQCDPTAMHAAAGCYQYSGCPEGSPVVLCNAEGGHRGWPDNNAAMLEFFEQFRADAK